MAVQAVDTPSPAMPGEARPNLELPGVLRRYPQFTISPAILVALIAAWWLATDVAGVPAYVMPPPEQVLHALIGGLSRAPWDKAGYWYHAGITVWEALLGFVIGSALGAFLGLVLSHWPLLGKSWYPYIVGFQSLPKVALAPLMQATRRSSRSVSSWRAPVTPVSCTSSRKSSSRAACHSCSPGSASLLCYRSSVPWLASSSAPVPASECS